MQAELLYFNSAPLFILHLAFYFIDFVIKMELRSVRGLEVPDQR